MYTIVTLPLIPVRSEADDAAEMTTQLFFGQQIEILETIDRWYRIKNLHDNDEGWIGSKTVFQKYFTEKPVDNSKFKPVKSPFIVCFKTSSVEKIILPGGSLLPKVQHEQFELCGEIYQLAQFELSFPASTDGMLIVELAKQYINSPYLWGGKALFGIDCSGLTQVVFGMIGKNIPRNSFRQVEEGKVVDFLSEAQAGDLAFFENEEGQIVHVGILVNSHQIIHASGYVKTEIIDNHGIISSQTGKYTHKLRVIKRIL